ncbi:MAG: PEP-CTERM sorting domain-containing protein [Akkermansia sp.]|nr:PEP-CTERM sorting domain-containing protein [Akkermansia sp.]
MKKSLIALLTLGSIAIAAPTTETFDFGGLTSIQLANQYDMSQDWSMTLHFKAAAGSSTHYDTVTIFSTTPEMGALGLYAPTKNLNPQIAAGGTTKTVRVSSTTGANDLKWTAWGMGIEQVCKISYDAAADKVTVSVDGLFSNQSISGVNFEGSVLTMLSTGITQEQMDTGRWGVFEGTFTGEAIAPNPDAPAVPEPTTATLSLLALAGLAARRRRK